MGCGRLRGGCAGKEFKLFIETVNYSSVNDCGGSLITSRLIATSFHCTDKKKGDVEPCDHSDGRRYAILGAHYLAGPEGKHNQYTIPIIDIESPPGRYYRKDVEESHDFALAVLKHAAKWSSKG